MKNAATLAKTKILVPSKLSIFVVLVSFMLAACGGSSNDNSSGYNGASKEELSDAKIYKADSPYANVAANCIRAKNDNEYCTANQFPLLGMETESPAVSDIMNRLVVSHAWMGERFEDLLNGYPEEMLYLFRGITAVVIDADIRPAYYTSSTGAIYLDAAYLWLTNDEKATINQKEDFRSGYSDPLDFRTVSRYAIGNSNAYHHSSLTGVNERNLSDIEYLLARLLLHELAHANDFFPHDRYDEIDKSGNLKQAANHLQNQYISSRLYQHSPLESAKLRSLAGVMYLGQSPTSEDLSTTALQAGEAFETEGAADHYAYSNQYEDLAMLFEEAMMKYFWDFDYDVGFINVPQTSSCLGLEVVWAQRNRIGDSNVKSRAQFVTNSLLPEVDMTMFYQQLEASENASNKSWCINRRTSDTAGPQKPSYFEENFGLETLKPYL